MPTLINLADDEQQSWWLDKAKNYEILGTSERLHNHIRVFFAVTTKYLPNRNVPDC